MKSTFGTNLKVFVEFALEQQLAARLALDPQPLGDRLLLFGRQSLLARPPRHRRLLPKSIRWCNTRAERVPFFFRRTRDSVIENTVIVES